MKTDNLMLQTVDELQTHIANLVKERTKLLDSNRELLEIANEVLNEWHSKDSNFNKKEPVYMKKIRTAIKNAKV